MRNETIAHRWANQVKPYGKNHNGSFWYDRTRLYSYRTEIARLYQNNTIAVYTSYSYSITTKGKHQTHIPYATKHLESYVVTCEMRGIPLDWDDAKHVIANDVMGQIVKHIERIKRSRSGFTYQLSYLLALVTDLKRLAIEHGANISIDSLPSTEHGSESDQIDAIARWLMTRYGIDVIAKIENERTISRKLNEKYEAELKQRALEKTETLTRWRNHEYHYPIYDCPVMLRIKGDTIETSHGANVPLTEAQALFKRLQAGEDIRNATIGGFTVSEVTNDTINIGCHRIPLSEVNRLFNQ